MSKSLLHDEYIYDKHITLHLFIRILYQGTRYTFEYLLRFVSRLSKDKDSVIDPREPSILRRFAGVLTHQDIVIDGVIYSATSKKTVPKNFSGIQINIHLVYCHTKFSLMMT